MKSKVREEEFGVLVCARCGSEIDCDENGDLPEICPNCAAELDYSDFIM